MIRFQVTHQSVKSSQGDIQRVTIVELRQPSVQKDVSSLGLIKHVSLNISEFGVPKKVFQFVAKQTVFKSHTHNDFARIKAENRLKTIKIRKSINYLAQDKLPCVYIVHGYPYL